jgi:hypothetical protein
MRIPSTAGITYGEFSFQGFSGAFREVTLAAQKPQGTKLVLEDFEQRTALNRMS